MIPPRGYLRRMIITFTVVAVPLLLGLILSYDLVKINWASTMEDQPAIEAQQCPRQWAPADSVRFDGASLPQGIAQQTNPVPADDVSLQRGKILFVTNCAPCHGDGGQGNGPLTGFWKPDMKKPANLTEARIAQGSDGTIYLTISQGYGAMPPLNENLTVRERWDVVNYVKNLGK